METRANYAIIGLFTIAVIAAAFGFVYWFSGTESGVKKAAYKIEFAGSVAGLSKGAPVLFNGIRVGDVTDVYFDKAKPEQAFAKVEVQPDTPIKSDTKAALDVALLSGAAVIALRGGSADAPALVKAPDQDLPTIVAERGGLASLLETARGTADRASALLDSINGIVGENRGSISNAIKNVESFSQALANNAPALDNLMSSVASAAQRIGPVAAKLETLTDETTALVRSVEPERVRNIVRNVEGVTQTVQEGREKIASLLSDGAGLMAQLNQSAPKLDQALSDVGRAAAAITPVGPKLATLTDETSALVRSVEPERLRTIVRNLEGVTQTVQDNRARIATFLSDGAGLMTQLNQAAPKLDQALSDVGRVLSGIDPVKVGQVVDNTQRFTAGLSASTPDLQATLRNSSSLTAKLDAAASRIDGVLKAAESFLGSAAGQEGKSTFESIRTAMDAFRKASENLDRRATEIAQGVSRFAGVGSRQVEALGGDARRAVNNVGRAARNLERNPSSVIFGGGGASIPEYRGR